MHKTTQVHVWQSSLLASNEQLSVLQQYLSPDEGNRLARLIFPEHRRRFLVARAGLRLLLSQYVQLPPAHIEFAYGTHGKPCLNPSQQPSEPLYFNVSHSQDWAMYAITHLGEVGIDIEQTRTEFPCLDVAKDNFSVQDYTEFTQHTSSQREEAFFRYWTRREAFMKATGLGLNLPPEQFDVSLNTPHPILHPPFTHPAQEAQTWHLYNLNAPQGFMSALAIYGNATALTQRTFSPFAPYTTSI